jgi:hypothetical protein
MAREDGANRDSALHSNFTKQYAATSAESKNNVAQNHASPLSSKVVRLRESAVELADGGEELPVSRPSSSFTVSL